MAAGGDGEHIPEGAEYPFTLFLGFVAPRETAIQHPENLFAIRPG
jgi:hypothetical protein